MRIKKMPKYVTLFRMKFALIDRRTGATLKRFVTRGYEPDCIQRAVQWAQEQTRLFSSRLWRKENVRLARLSCCEETVRVRRIGKAPEPWSSIDDERRDSNYRRRESERESSALGYEIGRVLGDWD